MNIINAIVKCCDFTQNQTSSFLEQTIFASPRKPATTIDKSKIPLKNNADSTNDDTCHDNDEFTESSSQLVPQEQHYTSISFNPRAKFESVTPKNNHKVDEINTSSSNSSSNDKSNTIITRIHENNRIQSQNLNSNGLQYALTLDSTSTTISTSNITSKFERSLTSAAPDNIRLSDFNLIKQIGKGSFGTVYLAHRTHKTHLYAIKEIHKRDEMNQYILYERQVLQNADHPFVMKLRYAFQDNKKLYIVTDFMPGGDLFTLIDGKRIRGEMSARFYAAEILLGIEYLHQNLKVMYRDLKPENILIDSSGHIKLTDFGLSRDISSNCDDVGGTIEYLAPEIVMEKTYDKSIDLWAFGCLLHEIIIGKTPFGVTSDYTSFSTHAENQSRILQNILTKKYTRHPKMQKSAYDLISSLLNRDPKQRIGYKSFDEIKRHQFFLPIDWEKMKNRKMVPPFVPDMSNISLNFDAASYAQNISKRTPQHDSQQLMDNKVNGFTFIGMDHSNNMSDSRYVQFMNDHSFVSDTQNQNRK